MKHQPNGTEVQELRKQLLDLLAHTRLENGEVNVASVVVPAVKVTQRMLGYEKFSRHLRMTDIVMIIVDSVTDHVKAIGKAKLPQSGTYILKDIIGDVGISSLEKEISDFLRSIPREYFTCWGLPNCKPFGFDTIDLAEGIALIEARAELGLPIGGGLFGLASLLPGMDSGKGLVANRVYLRVKTKGYASFDLDGVALRNALSRVKQVLALGISVGLLGKEYVDNVNSDFFMHSIRDVTQERQTPPLPADVSSYLASMTFKAGSSGALPLDEKHGPELIARVFKRARVVLDKPEDDSDATAIRTACEWYVDSHASRNETLAFLQACIGLEAILGEHSADEPITKRLADRCAYLIGNSIQERNEIRTLFIKVYDVRSKIVHGRRPTLSADEGRYFHAARDLLERVIKREVGLIQPAEGSAASIG